MTEVFGHLWGTAETRDLFEDAARTRIWLEVIGALAAEQGELGLIPEPAARAIAERAQQPVDLEEVALETRRSGHSTLGLIHVLQHDLGEAAASGCTTGRRSRTSADTWTGLVAQRMLAIAERDLGAIEASLVALADRHRGTVMLGRTHGQPGLPITFGFKAAVWAAEVRRHRERVAQAEPRLAVGQLAGAVGTLAAWGADGLELQRRVMERLGLGVPDVSWTSARDRVAELIGLLAMITATLAKIGNEVYNLQRAEIARARRGGDARRRREHHDAAEAQPGALRAPGHARAARARRGRAGAGGDGGRARARRRRLEGRVGAGATGVRGRRDGARARRRS